MKPLLTAMIGAATLLLPLEQAVAATTVHYDFLPASLACQGSLPAFSGTLRARPLAIQNEGSSNAFVTCGAIGDDIGTRAITLLWVRLLNNTAAPVTINCTFVEGWAGGDPPVYTVTSVNLPANSIDFAILSPSDGISIKYPQFNCSLPPGTAIGYVGSQYNLETGG